MVKPIGQQRSRLKVLRTGDPNSAFHTCTAEETLAMYGRPRYLLSSSTKSKKCDKVGVLNRVLYLPSGIFCPSATTGCLTSCLGHSSGRMQMPRSTRARDRRAALYLEDQEHFLALLRSDLYALQDEALQVGFLPAVRLNGTSDIPWERLHAEVFDEFPFIRFFDYTKLRPRMWHFLNGHTGQKPWPSNYHLTFSMSENNESDAIELLRAGGNVAAVFHSELPQQHLGYPVIDGDEHDARFLDPASAIVGLRAKGVAMADRSGFVLSPFSSKNKAA